MNETFTRAISHISGRTQRCLRALLLPFVLSVIFMLQNAAFNEWLHVIPNIYTRMYAATFALGMLLYGPSAFLRSRWRYAYLITISALVSILLMSEYAYYSYAGGFLQITALKLSGESGAVVGTAVRMLSPKFFLFLANLCLVILVAVRRRYRKILPTALSLGEKSVIMTLVLASIFGGYDTLLAAEKREWGDDTRLYSQQYDLNSVVGKMGVVNYFLEDAAKRALNGGKVTDEDVAYVKQWNSERPEPIPHIVDTGIAKGRNLIFIQIESLENAVINAKISGEEITPNLNALTKEGLYFSNYYAEVGMGNTADAEFSTLNSLYPLPDSVAFIDDAQNTYAALPKLLDDNGYHTTVFHGDVPTFWNRANIYPNLGYESWVMKDDFTSTRPIGITGLGDEDFFDQALPKVEALPQPFMATMITLSSHTPFILPEDLRTLIIPAGSGLNDTQTQYLESVHYADHAIGEFIDALKQSPLYKNSLIVIFGDHGSYTGIAKAIGTEASDVDGMDTAHVPLLILAPGTELKDEETMPASHVDVYPTVANLLGLSTPRSALGQDLLNTLTPVAVHRKTGTGGISAIVGSAATYVASANGVFEDGSCIDATSHQPLPINTCQSLYDQQSAIIRVSDSAVRGNLIQDLVWK